MARRKTDTPDQIVLRTSKDVRDRARALMPFMAKLSGLPASEADVEREALMRGLRELEREASKAKEGG